MNFPGGCRFGDTVNLPLAVAVLLIALAFTAVALWRLVKE